MSNLSNKVKICNKIISLLIIFLVLFSEMGIMLKYSVSYAIDTVNNNKHIDFNACFVDNAGETTYIIDSDEAKLYINLALKENGYLKNGVISFENENFDIIGEKVKNENIEKIENNVITLKQVNNGTNINLELPIKFKKSELINIEMFSKVFKTKITGTFVNGKAEEKEIESYVENKLSWTADAKANTSLNIQKYVPFNSNGNYGVLLQIRANTKVENNILPIKSTNIKIQSPEIDGKKATQVKVISNRTTATNGNTNGLEFNQNNWKYDNNNGIVDINVENTINDNNEVSYVQNSDDEYLISFIYEGKDIFDFVEEKGFISNIKSNTNISVYANNEMNLEENVFDGRIELNQKISDIVNFELLCENNEINKGQIYSNYNAKDKKEIEYNLKYIADIGYADISEYIEFNQSTYDEFITEDGSKALTTIGANNYTKNKTIKISVSLFNKILGEEGSIEVYNEDNKKIGTINKDTQTKNDNYFLDLSKANNNKLNIKTSKPISEGKLILDITKTISSKIDYSREQVETFHSLKSYLSGKTELLEMNSSDEIQLEEPVTKAEVKFNSDGNALDLSTTKEYENLEMRIVLDTSDTSNALYQNPSFEIRFPTVIKNIKLNDIKLINENNLKLEDKNIDKSNGEVVLKIKLKGTQTDYNVGDALKGTNIIINFGVELDKLATNSTKQIVLNYTNENSSLYEKANNEKYGIATTDINIVAPSGVIAGSGMTGYSDNEKEEVYTLNNKKIIKNISINSSDKNVEITNDIVNNYDNSIADVKILGTIPVNGNTILDGENKLNSNISTELISTVETNNIDKNKVKIYYTEKVNPTNDLNNPENGWTNSISNMGNVKSYMIVINEMKQGEHVNFKYNVKIPANLEFSQSAYSTYTAYYNNISNLGNFPETKQGAVLGVTTGAGPKLNVKLDANKPENTEVQAGGIIKFTASITNEGEADANNVKLTVPTPEGTKAIQYNIEYDNYDILEGPEQVYTLGKIAPGETITKVYEIQMAGSTNMFEDGYKEEILSQVSAVCDEDTKPVQSNTYTLYKIRGDIELELMPSIVEDQAIQKGTRIVFRTMIENISNTDINNFNIYATMPDGVKILEGHFEKDREITNDKVDINGNKIEGNLSNLEIGEHLVFVFKIEIEEFVGELDVTVEASGDNIEINRSNTLIYNVNSIDVSIVQTSSSPDYVQEGEDLKFSYTIKNNGNSAIPSITFTNPIPEGLKFVKAEQGVKDEEKDVSSNSISGALKTTIMQLEPGQEYIIDITFRALALPNENTKQVINYATLNIVNRYDIESNKITKYIEYNPSYHGEDPVDGRYVIAGVAWKDADMNGQRDVNEEMISGLEVMLLDKSTNEVMKDPDTNNEKITTTDSNGAYRFDNLPVGKYAVVFLYDSGKYSITEYQKKDVNQTVNSDAVEVDLVYDGQKRKAGMTDSIKITSSNVRNIDIGLYETERFDLSLTKYVSKITLTTPTIGTKQYEYNNSVAKVEVLGRNLRKSSMLVEYKIIVKNEGAVPGYAKKIIDYLPDEFTFNSELNKDWYKGKDGNLYTSCLENEEIKPGEEKEITLVVNKKITENTIGIINNTAEIYEAYNEMGLEDVDSTPGNKVANEDDMSSSDVVVSLVTGKIIAYTFIICVVLGLLTIGIYLIKRNVLDLRKK